MGRAVAALLVIVGVLLFVSGAAVYAGAPVSFVVSLDGLAVAGLGLFGIDVDRRTP